jgi:hypothetical protein
LRASVDETVPERVCQAETVFFRFFSGWCATVALGLVFASRFALR